MDSNPKVRARRREDREQERQEKLKGVQVSSPKKFTLDESAPVASPSADPARAGRGGRGGQGASRGPASGRGGRTFGGVPMESGGGQGGGQPRQGGAAPGRGARRVITLERPRNEHLRPVNITVQRMYFGDWSLENMPPDDGQQQQGGGRPPRPEGRGAFGGRGGGPRGGEGRQAGGRPSGPENRPAPQASAPTARDDAGKRRRRRRGRRSGE